MLSLTEAASNVPRSKSFPTLKLVLPLVSWERDTERVTPST
jgi:hypothetical protein